MAVDAIPSFRAAWLGAGAITVDATPPIDDVGRALLTEAASAVLRLRRVVSRHEEWN